MLKIKESETKIIRINVLETLSESPEMLIVESIIHKVLKVKISKMDLQRSKPNALSRFTFIVTFTLFLFNMFIN